MGYYYSRQILADLSSSCPRTKDSFRDGRFNSAVPHQTLPCAAADLEAQSLQLYAPTAPPLDENPGAPAPVRASPMSYVKRLSGRFDHPSPIRLRHYLNDEVAGLDR
jgi:hypothetical protein